MDLDEDEYPTPALVSPDAMVSVAPVTLINDEFISRRLLLNATLSFEFGFTVK